ncbi:hypothetical protein APUTEX25_001093, partial [Auxenochlorella protothecoides]
AFALKGMHMMYPWQSAALEEGWHGDNLVYSAPTSGGKSLVADLLLIKALGQLRLNGMPARGLVILPYLSIVQEKADHLSFILGALGCSVKGYTGGLDEHTPLGVGGERVAICSMEKAHVVLDRLTLECRLGEVGCIVVDEAHMVADPNRGPGLEAALSKVLASRHRPQIIAMSATVGGLQTLSEWLQARMFLTNFRPVPLTEHVVFQGTVYMKAEGQSVLVFCVSRRACEACAALLTDRLGSRRPEDLRLTLARQELLADMRGELGGEPTPGLSDCILHGVAFHHAGLTVEERTGVEQGFRAGIISPGVITSETNLSASKEKGLLESRAPGDGSAGVELCTTHKGRAVFDSGLPLDMGMALYGMLKGADAGVALDCPAQIIFYCLLDHPFVITSWQAWAARLRSLPSRASARHARWAASLALAGMVEGAAGLGETVLAWGGERCFSPAGLSAGQLQRLLADCGRWLGMAALVCESAGWWLLGTLCAELAGRATAGVPADLVQLMGVRGMTPARARALHEAGVCVSWGLVGGGWEKGALAGPAADSPWAWAGQGRAACVVLRGGAGTQEVGALLSSLQAAARCAVALNCLEGRALGLALAWEEGRAWYVSLTSALLDRAEVPGAADGAAGPALSLRQRLVHLLNARQVLVFGSAVLQGLSAAGFALTDGPADVAAEVSRRAPHTAGTCPAQCLRLAWGHVGTDGYEDALFAHIETKHQTKKRKFGAAKHADAEASSLPVLPPRRSTSSLAGACQESSLSAAWFGEEVGSRCLAEANPSRAVCRVAPCQTPAAWHSLMDDVLNMVARFLPPSSLRILRLVCRSWERALGRRLLGIRPEALPAVPLAARFPSLRWLTLSHCGAAVSACRPDQLRLLSTLRDEDLQTVAGLAHLSALSLYNCAGLTGEGLRHLASLPRLRRLNLGRCAALRDAHLAHLLRLPCLQSLSLHRCPGVGDAGLALLAAHPTLAVVLAPNATCDAGCAALARAPALMRVVLHDCPRLGTAGVQALLHAPGVRQVVISRCPHVDQRQLTGYSLCTQLTRRGSPQPK